MKILYPAFIRLPTEKAHGVQIVKTCEAFAEAGVDVELVIPGRKTQIQESVFAYYGAKNNFSIVSTNTPDLVAHGPIGFFVSALWFAEAVKWQKSFWKADVIYSRDAFVLLQYILLGRKLVYEAHTKPTVISTFVAKRVHRLVVISEGLRDAYLKRGVSSVKIIVAHDAIDLELFKKEHSQTESRQWLGIPQDKKIALYVGRIDAAKGADTFAAVSELVSNDWLCVLIGSGPLKKMLQKQYPKALFLSETPYRELARVLATADVLVLPNSGKDENASKYTSPLKAFAYLAAQKPIVAANVPALETVLQERAHYFSADSSQSLLSSLERLSSETEYNDLSSHTWHIRSAIILKAFE